MKKNIVILIVFLMNSIIIWGQKHVEFQGIPIDLTISQFSSKLRDKNFIANTSKSATNEPIKYFDGYFFGKKCELLVFYNPKSKIVYRTKVIIDCSSKRAADDLIEDLKNGYNRKYGEWSYENFNVDGYPGWRRTFVDKNFSSYNEEIIGYLVIGEVQMWISYFSYTDEYLVHIDYYDAVNVGKYYNDIENDL